MTDDTELIAPRWHTALLVSVMLGVAVLGVLLTVRGAAIRAPADAGTRLSSVYLPMIVVQWGLVLYVCRVGRRKSALRSLLGKGWGDRRRVVGDIAAAIACGAAIVGLEHALSRLWRVGRNASLSALLPHTASERLIWIAVAASAGFCEEVVYRGYLQRQLAAFTASRAAGLALSAVLFGVAHAEQGVAAALRAVAHGFVFGVCAAWRQSLIPGILCHVAIDLASGLLVR